MSAIPIAEEPEIVKARVGDAALPTEKEIGLQEHRSPDSEDSVIDADTPSEEDLKTLRRVSGPIPWTALSVGFVEACERFSYYGTTAVFTNFIQRPLPAGSPTGAGFAGQSGALGLGQRASFSMSMFNTFWGCSMPLLGAYLADAHWGRFKTIFIAIGASVIGHVIVISAASPNVINKPQSSIGALVIGTVVLGVGTGGFKANIGPLLAEQQTETRMRISTTKKGERVILDPTITTSRIFMYFYLVINIGALLGSISMVYAEKYVGFWLSWLLPTLLFLVCPAVLWFCRKFYVRTPPTSSVLGNAVKLLGLGMKGRWSANPVRTMKNIRDDEFWDRIKPSKMSQRPVWMTFDDAWVDEVRRGVKACTVFLWFPIWYVCYGQMTGNMTSQAATMELHGLPNDLIGNLSAILLIILIPIFDFIIYPTLRKFHIRFTPLKRIYFGFILASIGMVATTVTQYYIYKLGPCGEYMNTCEVGPAPISVGVQVIPYIFSSFSEILAAITGLEFAFTKAPKNMRSLVMAIFLFMNAFSAALSQAFTALSEDPLLVWDYATVAIVSFIGGNVFWLAHRKLDKEEDRLNMLVESSYIGKGQGSGIDDVEKSRVAEPVEAEKKDFAVA